MIAKKIILKTVPLAAMSSVFVGGGRGDKIA